MLDLSQFLISCTFAAIGSEKNPEIDEGLLRHILLNSLRAVRLKFKEEQHVVIACDGSNYWRRECFPYYKAARRKKRADDAIDWDTVYKSLDKFKIELREFFPYKVMEVDRAEADDIIAVLVKYFQEKEPIVIASSDKDYRQLHTYRNVRQFSPVSKEFIRCDDPMLYIKEHVIKGDSGDGIPNCLSQDDIYMLDKRSKPVTQKRLVQLLDNYDNTANLPILGYDSEVVAYLERNKKLIDFENIPMEVRDEILDEFWYQKYGNKDQLFNYFIKFRLKNLMDSIQDF